jgi:hypothetical protein
MQDVIRLAYDNLEAGALERFQLLRYYIVLWRD